MQTKNPSKNKHMVHKVVLFVFQSAPNTTSLGEEVLFGLVFKIILHKIMWSYNYNKECHVL